MAKRTTESSKSTTKTPSKQSTSKRQLRAKPTLRDQAAAQNTKDAKNNRVRKVRKAIATQFRWIGRGIKRVWQSKPLTPLRWIGRIIVPRYLRNAFAELKLVSWPKAGLVWRLTGAVLVFAVVLGLFIAGLDFVFEKLFREILLG